MFLSVYIPTEGQCAQVLLEEFQTFLDKRATDEVALSEIHHSFNSTYFLIPKKIGHLSSILILKPFRKFVPVPKFEMETAVENVVVFVHSWIWLVTIDLKVIYFTSGSY